MLPVWCIPARLPAVRPATTTHRYLVVEDVHHAVKRLPVMTAPRRSVALPSDNVRSASTTATLRFDVRSPVLFVYELPYRGSQFTSTDLNSCKLSGSARAAAERPSSPRSRPIVGRAASFDRSQPRLTGSLHGAPTATRFRRN